MKNVNSLLNFIFNNTVIVNTLNPLQEAGKGVFDAAARVQKLNIQL